MRLRQDVKAYTVLRAALRTWFKVVVVVVMYMSHRWFRRNRTMIQILLLLWPSKQPLFRTWIVGYVLFSGVLETPGMEPADRPSHS